MCASARALFARQNANIAGAIANHRECFLGQTGEYQLTALALRQNLTGVRVNDLCNEVIFIDMHAVLFLALEGDTRTGNFGQTIDIIRLDAKRFFNVVTHFFRPCLCAEDAGLELELIAQTALTDALTQICGIRRCAAQNGGTEIHHKLQLTFGIAGRHRQSQAANFMSTAMYTSTAGKQTIAVCNVADILIRAACCYNRARTALFPQINIMLGVERNHASASRAAGGVHPHAILERLCQQTIRILFLQIVLCDKRQQMQIFNAVNIFRLNACFVHLVAIKFYVIIYMLDLCNQTLTLQCLQLVNRHRLNFRLIILAHLPIKLLVFT